jgi:hypothetical protein
MSETKDRLLRGQEAISRPGLFRHRPQATRTAWSSMYHFFPDGKEQLAEEVIRYGGEL